MFGGINNIYMGGYKFSAHCTNISAHKIYSRASLFICGEYFLDRTAISSEGCRPHDAKGFQEVYKLGGNTRGYPWCGRPTRYMR